MKNRIKYLESIVDTIISHFSEKEHVENEIHDIIGRTN